MTTADIAVGGVSNQTMKRWILLPSPSSVSLRLIFCCRLFRSGSKILQVFSIVAGAGQVDA